MARNQTTKISGFAAAVYHALEAIPAGRVTSYREIARAIGHPQAVRAVGNALHNNPYAPQIPCHRVVYSDGRVGNYAKGSEAKIRLLKAEGVAIEGSKVQDFSQTFYRFP